MTSFQESVCACYYIGTYTGIANKTKVIHSNNNYNIHPENPVMTYDRNQLIVPFFRLALSTNDVTQPRVHFLAVNNAHSSKSEFCIYVSVHK